MSKELHVTAEQRDFEGDMATLSLQNHVFNPETAIVLWDPKENQLLEQDELEKALVLYETCGKCAPVKASNERFEFCRLPDYSLMSETDKMMWLGQGADCFYPRGEGQKPNRISLWRHLAMLQTPLSTMPGEAGNPIDLTAPEDVAAGSSGQAAATAAC